MQESQGKFQKYAISEILSVENDGYATISVPMVGTVILASILVCWMMKKILNVWWV